MRPARSSETVVEHIHQSFNPNAFHFNKPFLKSEIFWEGEWAGKEYRVLYNKFPFAPWHLLIVPEANRQQPQFLTKEAHQDIFKLSTKSMHLSGLGIAYNSLGANASINQLHFQGFIFDQALPIEAPGWKQNGGNKQYPVNCYNYSSHKLAWQKIKQLHAKNQPYNLLYRNGFCYVIPRKGQGKVGLSEWVSGIGWYEISGMFTLLDYDRALHLSANSIYKELNKFSR
jgi:ATP adenylyltransferase/5',5'''-P-1,P-4-tetraphosphate phosphorylase II